MFEDVTRYLEATRRGVPVAIKTMLMLAGTVDERELTALLVDLEATRRALDAAQLVVVAEVARRDLQRGPDGMYRDVRLPAGEVADHAADSVALAIGARPGEASTRCDTAAWLLARASSLLELMATGTVREAAVRAVREEVRDVDEDVEAAVVAHVAADVRGRPGVSRLEALEPREVARSCRRVIDRQAPEVLAARAERHRREEPDVRLQAGPIGTSCLTAVLPSEVGAAVLAAVDEVAADRRAADPTLRVGASRALAFADLALRGVDVVAHVRLGLPVVRRVAPASGGEREAADGAGHGFAPASGGKSGVGDAAGGFAPASGGERATGDIAGGAFAPASGGEPWVGGVEVPGVGYIPADVVATLTARLDTRVSRALLDSSTGTVLETSTPGYAIPQGVRDLVTLRDGVCRMWGCTRRATRCDLDHAVAYPEGATSPRNLGALCRHHHRVKHAPGWTHHLDPDGSVRWVTPGGVPAFTYPDHHAIDLPEPEPEPGPQPVEERTAPAAPAAHGSATAAPGSAAADSPPPAGAKVAHLAEAYPPPPF